MNSQSRQNKQIRVDIQAQLYKNFIHCLNMAGRGTEQRAQVHQELLNVVSSQITKNKNHKQ